MRLGAQNGPSTGSSLAPWRDLENVNEGLSLGFKMHFNTFRSFA